MENQPKNTTKNSLIGIILLIALFLVFIIGLVLWRKWTISQSIEVTIEITDKWTTADEHSISWQYAVAYYNSSESTETLEKFFDTEKTNIQGMSVGTFISDVDYKIGDKVDGYLRKSVNEYYFMPK